MYIYNLATVQFSPWSDTKRTVEKLANTRIGNVVFLVQQEQ